jgi:hypothetical protein
MRYVVTLIHGTWAYGPPFFSSVRRWLRRAEPQIWIDEGSAFSQYLDECLRVDDVPPVILPFRWSGRNRVLDARMLQKNC